MADSLLIQQIAANPSAYSADQKIRADVNASSTVSALDALYVKLYTVGSVLTFPVCPA